MFSRIVFVCFAGLLIPGLARAQGESQAVIERALKAHGGEETLSRFQARQVRIKGTLPGNNNAPFSQEFFFQPPGQARDLLTIEANGKQSSISYALNGNQGWLQVDGKTQDLPESMLGELREAIRFTRLAGLHGLKDPANQLTALPAVEIDGRAALGVRLANRGFRDIDLYFDRETNLLVMAVHQVLDSRSKQLVKEERYYSAWKDINGVKTPTHIEVVRDGKKFMSADAVEIKFFERLDERTFAKP